MKRAGTIFLLMLFLFNVGGYYLVFMGLRHQVGAELRARLDAEQYSRDELIELKLPVTLPYPLQEQGFQRVDGKFEHQGQFYKLVKQKLENDTLYVLLIRNVEEESLVTAFKKYATLTLDVPAASKKTFPSILIKFLAEFEAGVNDMTVPTGEWTSEISYQQVHLALLSRANTVLSPPPEA